LPNVLGLTLGRTQDHWHNHFFPIVMELKFFFSNQEKSTGKDLSLSLCLFSSESIFCTKIWVSPCTLVFRPLHEGDSVNTFAKFWISFDSYSTVQKNSILQKAGPPKSVWLANQIQGFRIPGLRRCFLKTKAIYYYFYCIKCSYCIEK